MDRMADEVSVGQERSGRVEGDRVDEDGVVWNDDGHLALLISGTAALVVAAIVPALRHAQTPVRPLPGPEEP
ncbi:hypothetical protein [Streptomyces longisporus]|uniref:Uncharacterized protein n=1 Tax=Streptomyces longisporus TaxID=1948 RepID=A0ABN3NC89_STRLO